MKKLFFLFGLIYLLCYSAQANNVQVSNISYDKNSQNVSFDVSWENSWTYNNGHFRDAVWLFVKLNPKNGNGTWLHGNLDSNDNGSASTGFILETVPDNKGVFIYRDPNSDASGNTGTVRTTIKLDNQVNQLLNPDIKVFAIEMVRVPKGAFYVGDGNGNTSANSFYKTDNQFSGKPYQITSEGSITIAVDDNDIGKLDGGLGSTYYTNGFAQEYPKGFEEFYSMKYEMTQIQFAEMLNTMNLDDIEKLFPRYSQSNPFPLNNGNGVVGRQAILAKSNSDSLVHGTDLNENGILNEEDDGKEVAYASSDLLELFVFLDWACLRPFSIFEYEKMCRGTLYPTESEFAWGSQSTTPIDLSLLENPGTHSETLSNAGITIGYVNFDSEGAVRSGITMTSSTTNRLFASASYYGIADLTGNVSEPALYSTLADFTRTHHGDGDLNNYFFTDIRLSFPAGLGNLGNVLVVPKGGDFKTTPTEINKTVSSMALPDLQNSALRYGIRGVRSIY